MQSLRKLGLWLKNITRDSSFIRLIHYVENIVSKILSLVLVVVILAAVIELITVFLTDFLSYPFARVEKSLFEIFGLFLNILIAFELLENITSYLKKHVVQVELVIVTSLIAVARKIIIFDFTKYESWDLISLALAILALSASYWLIKKTSLNKR